MDTPHSTITIIIALLVGLLLSSTLRAADELTLKQKILMPGPLIEGHADIEAECDSCHTPFTKQAMTDRCLDCHEDIAADRTNKSGFHGISPAAGSGACENCHIDHEGREADITGLFPDSFNHHHTDFALDGAHVAVACDNCHGDKPFREAETQCLGCHREQDRHRGALGEQCEQCHQTSHWSQRLAFDHSTTQFPLLGLHRETLCISCHIDQQFQSSDQRCVACHRANDVHHGSNGEDCASCHSPGGWDEVKFDHGDTDFPLLGRHDSIPCRACHSPGQARDNTPTACNSCHQGDDIHLSRNGTQCQQCHSASSWKQVAFKHNVDTDFPLTGVHQKLACVQCHTGTLKETLPRDCGGCHRGDDVHNDPTMSLCGTCHSTESWKGVSQFDHDLSQFPLLGMHRIVPCNSCHIGHQFNLSSSECVACHQQEDKHQGGLGDNCSQCHTPNAWTLWQFDHSRQTEFQLDGKHQGLECAACHLPDSDPAQTPTLCGGCHRQQDIHNGEFGDRCERCHSTTNFFELNLE